MIKQVIFSGNVPYNESTIVDPASTDQVYKACEDLGLTGLKLYIDGQYFLIAEGSPPAVQTLQDIYTKHKKLSNLLVLLESNVKQAEFEDFKIYFHERNAHAVIPKCFILDEKNLDAVLTSNSSQVTNILVKTFARINNLIEA